MRLQARGGVPCVLVCGCVESVVVWWVSVVEFVVFSLGMAETLRSL
jgi:hypothetical protein